MGRRGQLHPQEAVRAPFPEHLPRERVVIPAPPACPCLGVKLVKLGKAYGLELKRWAAFTRFLSDGRICLPITPPSARWLFASSDREIREIETTRLERYPPAVPIR